MIKIELFSSFLKNNFYLSISKEIAKRENHNHHIRKKNYEVYRNRASKSKLYFYYKEVILHLPHIRIKESRPKVPESSILLHGDVVSIDATESVWKGAMASKLHKGRNPTKIAISAQYKLK
jgi:hypothetical protein